MTTNAKTAHLLSMWLSRFASVIAAGFVLANAGCDDRQNRTTSVIFQHAGYSRQFVLPVVFNGGHRDLSVAIAGDATRVAAEDLGGSQLSELVAVCESTGRPRDVSFVSGIRIDLLRAAGAPQTLYIHPTEFDIFQWRVRVCVPASSRLVTLLSDSRRIAETSPR